MALLRAGELEGRTNLAGVRGRVNGSVSAQAGSGGRRGPRGRGHLMAPSAASPICLSTALDILQTTV